MSHHRWISSGKKREWRAFSGTPCCGFWVGRSDVASSFVGLSVCLSSATFSLSLARRLLCPTFSSQPKARGDFGTHSSLTSHSLTIYNEDSQDIQQELEGK